ncbi:MAG: T9SS type A sorting domain-containing protein [Flavobacteriales bacterium]|nr:T9SS type A sorting domain-containing protein [Flavobacteriales bacterium]
MPAAPGVSVGGAGQTPGGKGGDGRVWNLPSNQAYNGNNGGASYGAGGGGALVHQGSYGVGKGNGGLGSNGAVIIEYTPSGTPPAQPSPISGNPNLCDVNSGTYSVTNVAGVTYTWTYTGTATVTPGGNSVTLTNITSGGTLTVTPSNACGNGPSQSIIIQIANSSIAPTSISGIGPYCQGSTVTLTQNGGSLSGSSIYQWYTGSCGGTLVGTGPSINVTPGATTTYYVQATSNGPCPATTCASGTVTLPTPGITLALNGESATCIVNAGETVRFYEPVSGRYIGTITANAIGLGLTTNTVYVDIGNQMPAACVYDFSQTAVMERHWVITPTVNASAKVRLPYSLTEYNNLVIAAAVSSNPYDGVSSQNDIKLSKYSNTINPALVNNNASDNCPSGTTTIHSYSATGINNPAPGVNARYSDFNISGFSEFWLHGSSNNSPLPVELLSFFAACDKNTVQITWQTATETNNDYFIVEKSMNAETWTEVNMQPGAGNSNSTQTYTFTDAKPFNGTSYYRLRQVDYNGTIDVFAPVSVSCMSSTETDYITVYPNPNNGAFTIHLNAGNAYGVGIIEITDLLGRKVLSEKIEVQEGGNTYSLSDERLAAGTYHVSIVLNGVALLMDKLVIQ